MHKKLSGVLAGLILAALTTFGAFTVMLQPTAPLAPPSGPETTSGTATDESATTTADLQASASAPTTTPQVRKKPTDAGCSLALSLLDNHSASIPDVIDATLSNQGDHACQKASLSAYYASTLAFISSSPLPTASNYYWELGDIGPGQVKRIRIDATLASSGPLAPQDTQACGTADNGADACAHMAFTGASPVTAATVDASAAVPPPAPAKLAAGQEYGSWVWVSPDQMTADYMRTVVDSAASNGINVLYVTIDGYLAVADLPEGDDKTRKLQAFSDALDRFVALAGQKGIAVDAEAGWRDWAETAQKAKASAIVSYVVGYNASHARKLRSLQFDIEPYLLPAYQNDKAPVLLNFVTLIDETVHKLGTADIGFSVVVPHFYDDMQQWTPAITYGGVNTYAYNHLLSIMDGRPGGRIIVMAYRDKALDDNGSVDLARTEVNEASDGTHATKIVVAQESGDVRPASTTFFSKSKAAYAHERDLVVGAFAGKPGFGGMAIHDIDGFMRLK